MTVDIVQIIDKIKQITIKKFEYCITDVDNFFPPDLQDSEIREFEREFKVKLPPDVDEYLRLFSGEGKISVVREGERTEEAEIGIFLGLSALSLEDIIREMRIWKEVWTENPEFEDQEYESVPEGAINAQYVDADNWIGLATDGGGNSIGVDLNPGPRGKYGQVIMWGRDYYDERVVLFDSWSDFLERVLKDLENPELSTVDKEYNVYDFPEVNYLDYLIDERLKELGRETS